MYRTTHQAILLAVLTVTAVACGSRAADAPATDKAPATAPSSVEAPAPGTGAATPSASTTAPNPATSTHGALAHCLSEHGVSEPSGPAAGPAPGPVAAPPGVDQTTWDDAMQACSKLGPGPR